MYPLSFVILVLLLPLFLAVLSFSQPSSSLPSWSQPFHDSHLSSRGDFNKASTPPWTQSYLDTTITSHDFISSILDSGDEKGSIPSLVSAMNVITREEKKSLTRILRLGLENIEMKTTLSVDTLVLAQDSGLLVQAREYGAHYLTTGYLNNEPFPSLVSIDRTKGIILWKYDLKDEIRVPRILLSTNNIAVLLPHTGGLVAIEIGSDDILWSRKDIRGTWYPIVDNEGYIYVFTGSSLTLEKLSPSSGRTVFSVSNSNMVSSSVAVSNKGTKNIYIAGFKRDERDYCVVSISQQTGVIERVNWNKCVAHHRESTFTRLFIDKEVGRIYLLTTIISPQLKLTKVYCLAADSGSSIWTSILSDKKCMDALVTEDGHLIVRCQNTIYMLNGKSGDSSKLQSIYEKDQILIDSANNFYLVNVLEFEYVKSTLPSTD